MKGFAALALTFAVSACASGGARIDLPATLTGSIQRPSSTGWFVDYCNGGVLVESGPNCGQLGGEIYRVVFRADRARDETAMRALVIAFPAHALSPSYRAHKRVHLVTAPEAFAKATGIVYFAVDWDDP